MGTGGDSELSWTEKRSSWGYVKQQGWGKSVFSSTNPAWFGLVTTSLLPMAVVAFQKYVPTFSAKMSHFISNPSFLGKTQQRRGGTW